MCNIPQGATNKAKGTNLYYKKGYNDNEWLLWDEKKGWVISFYDDDAASRHTEEIEKKLGQSFYNRMAECRRCGGAYDQLMHDQCPCFVVSDSVNHPGHYQSDSGIECIDAIRAAVGDDGFVAHCRATAIKYAWRSGKKLAHAEDLRKAAWYLERAASVIEERG